MHGMGCDGIRWDGIGAHGSFWGALRDKGQGVPASTGTRGVKSGAVTRGCPAGGPRGDAAAAPGLLRCRRFVLCLFSRLFSAERWGFSLLKARAGLGVTGAHAAPPAEGGGGGCWGKAALFLCFLKLYYDILFFSGGCLCVFPPPPPSPFNPYNLNQKCRGEEGGERCVCRARPGVNLLEG